MSAQHHGQLIEQFAPADIVVLLCRQSQRMAGSLSAGNNSDQVDLIAAFKHMPDNSMSAFVDSHHALVLVADLMAFLFRTHLDPGNRIHQQLLVDLLFPGPGSQYRRFVHHVFQIRAGSVRHPLCDIVQIHIAGKGLPFAVYLQDCDTAFLIGIVNCHLPVKTSGSHQGGIQNITAVGCRHHDNAFVHREAVHFHKKLIQCLFAFIVASAESGAAVASDRIDLINEHNCRSNLFRLIEQIADTACADAYEHFNKITAADGEERNAGFPGYSFGQQGFARSGRTDQQHALGDTGAQLSIAFRILQKIHHFLKLFLFLVSARYVCEGDFIL